MRWPWFFVVCFRYWCWVIAVGREVLDFVVGGFVGRGGEKVDGGFGWEGRSDVLGVASRHVIVQPRREIGWTVDSGSRYFRAWR